MFRYYKPPAPLSKFIEMFWYFRDMVPLHARERLLPTGTAEIVINLREDSLHVYHQRDENHVRYFRGAMICGVHSKYFVIDTAQQAEVMGIHFKPGGAFPFFEIPSNEFHNEHISLENLWGQHALDLREQLLEVETIEKRFFLLEHFMWARITQPLVQHRAVGFALQELSGLSNGRTISDVSDQIGLSQRHFIQVFSEEVGLTPKLFYRVQRFQQVLQCISTKQPIDWIEIALKCGYYDQSHFIHDFRSFSGLTPSEYQFLCMEHLNHVPLLV